MEPASPLWRIFQLAVQEENQRIPAFEHARTGEGITLIAFGSRLSLTGGFSPELAAFGSRPPLADDLPPGFGPTGQHLYSHGEAA